ncbi:unnamed protein product [Cyclocybe aegerita]|uniref:DNA sliding clamp PCNA n=1 Tax=Cyclocybe aegerita TaxID=1973307 RepID=A0A8S0VSP5_CYCAE|nr:unnamed protein product [Cyclocybe aegerita]
MVPFVDLGVRHQKLACSKEGIMLQGMDEFHISLVEFFLSKRSFESYALCHDLCMSLPIDSLATVLKKANDDDVCTLKAGHKAKVLTVAIETRDQPWLVSKHDVPFIDLGSEYLVISRIPYDAKITVWSTRFARLAHELHQLSGSLDIQIIHEGARFTALDEGSGKKGCFIFRRAKVVDEYRDSEDDEPAGAIIHEFHRYFHKATSLRVSTKYLVHASKRAPLSSKVSVLMKEDQPLLVQYDFYEGVLKFYIAPRIADEEEN